jgi:hypothetical protein
MATARPKSTADTAPQPQDAEHAFYRVIEAQAADLRAVRRCWPHRERPEVTEALTRLRARAAPDGEADAAMALVRAAYGGDVPLPGAYAPGAVRRGAPAQRCGAALARAG